MKTIRIYATLAIIIAGMLPMCARADELVPIQPQDTTAEQPATLGEQPAELAAKITSEDYILYEKKSLFDASESTLLPSDSQPTYRWEFSDVPTPQFGKEVIREFKQTGIHRVTLTIQQGDVSDTASKEVFVYDQKVLMITDKNLAKEFKLIVNQAANDGVLLKVVSAVEEETGFLTEEKLVPLIGEEAEFIRDTDGLIFYTNASRGLQAFTRYWQGLGSDKTINLDSIQLVVVTEQNMSIAADLAQQSYEVMKPKNIIVTRTEALNPLFETKNYNEFVTKLDDRAIEYRIVDARSGKSDAFFLSRAITTFIAKGIPTNTIYLLLAFPFIAFVVTFFRQVIGLSAFGIYTPTVTALSLLILGIYFGIGTLLIVVAVSYLLRMALNKFKLLYIPKTSLILSSIALSFLGLIWFLAYYRVSLAISLAIFPMLVMSTISEKFLSAQSEEGLGEALWGVVKTILIAVVAYYLVVWTAFTNLIMSWPELIVAPLLGIILLGRFTGLRFTEYIRFRSLLKEKQIEE
ncbi:MAG: 7TM domain-containing protein [Patescibacteria group bacterium]|nr:7TM domain-containing protein [Patescibacteria group bacterium]MDD5715566.1 7TM domain-containing protein [Patescibacteria group bacterium]